MAVDLILIVKSNIIIIMMNTDKKIINFYLEFSKTRKIDVYEFSLQSIKAMRFNSTYPRTF